MTKGKVTLPTAERITEIKVASDEFWIKADNSRGLESHLCNEVFELCTFNNELLAALEEARHQVKFITVARDHYKELSARYGEELGELRGEVKRLREALGIQP
ncbi:hypothetical protein KIH86_22980 [Paenibacillus sp. HN-1]|uniref:hypothetical protein n=1 Tax=Paenibacillus TaxID=44249 RepID=UPI001CA9EE84|nr:MULTISPECIES: hypothetical protein [Paenibacillus]MBY9081020.1 hypothetical protein [Paenibacillus sp. CGMCC 1.18879]MBY9087057.1 hypothetical protein [Paenibacillus sinensis]